MQKRRITPLLAAIAGLVLAFGVSAFTRNALHKAKADTIYYYTFVGAQTQSDREDGHNYTTPSLNPLSCASGSINECGVAVKIPSGMSAPANISGLTITYASGTGQTGFPNGGASLSANLVKDMP